MDVPHQEHSHLESLPTGLIIIARDVRGQVITRLTCTRSREVVSAMKSARSVLQLEVGAVGVEIYRQEVPTSIYPGKPLVAMSRDDLIEEQAR